jgi:hypothetical protein
MLAWFQYYRTNESKVLSKKPSVPGHIATNYRERTRLLMAALRHSRQGRDGSDLVQSGKTVKDSIRIAEFRDGV